MLHQKANIGFVVWGVRNGFEVMLASNLTEAEILKSDVVSDNMRQVCNTTSESFFSIHRNQRFGVVTIYHCDAKDMVGRKAYVAISLYIPSTYQFVGDVYAVLNQLKSFYIQKQGDSYVNMFTAEMFTEQYRSLDCQQNNGFIIPGTKKGYYKFTSLNEIRERFQLLDISGYQAAFFIPSNVTGPETQLSGYQAISEFKQTITVTIEGFDSSSHKILFKDQPIETSQNRFSLEVKPGEELVISEIVGNRRQSFSKYMPNQVINLATLFPKAVATGYNYQSSDAYDMSSRGGSYGSPKKSTKWRNILAWSLILVIFSTLGIMALVEEDIIENPLSFFSSEPKPQVEETQVTDEKAETDGKAILPKFNTLKKSIYDVNDLYIKVKLTGDDTVKIKEHILKINGIKSIIFTGSLAKIEVSYDEAVVEKPVYTSLKSIKLNPDKEVIVPKNKTSQKPTKAEIKKKNNASPPATKGGRYSN